MKVEDVMVRNVKSILPDILVRQALDALKENKISGLPVVDKNRKLVGMFTEKEILQYLLPGYLQQVGSFVYRDNPKAIVNKIKELLLDKKVSDIMRTHINTVKADTSLSEVARKMLMEKIRRLPVVDDTGKVIGIIAREDVVWALMKAGM
jgi:CBS domain-containing protein